MRRTNLSAGPEFDRIRAFLETAAAHSDDPAVWLGPGDDAAVLEPAPGERLVLSTDLAVEEVHFRRAWLRWEAVGYRATAAGLSDLAAMAARPLGVLLSVALPPELDREVFEELARGAGSCLNENGGALLGGDLSRSPGPVLLDVVAVGAAARPIRRKGTRPGDELWVTGLLGAAASAASDWARGLEPHPRARRAFERPRPRLAEARWLAERARLHGLIDLSDGLAGDAGHLAAASGIRIEIDVSAVPVAEALERYAERAPALRHALGGGEDYELLLAASAGEIAPLVAGFRRRFDLPLTRVGTALEGSGVGLVDSEGRELGSARGGHDHFSGRDAAGRGS